MLPLRAADQPASQDGEGTPEAKKERQYQAVKLPRHVRQRLRVCAAFLDVEISALVTDAVMEHLDRLDRERRAQGLVPLPSADPDARLSPAKESPGRRR